MPTRKRCDVVVEMSAPHFVAILNFPYFFFLFLAILCQIETRAQFCFMPNGLQFTKMTTWAVEPCTLFGKLLSAQTNDKETMPRELFNMSWCCRLRRTEVSLCVVETKCSFCFQLSVVIIVKWNRRTQTEAETERQQRNLALVLMKSE